MTLSRPMVVADARPSRGADLAHVQPRSSKLSATALVLNAGYEPLCIVSTRRAAVLVLTHKAVSVTDGDTVLHSQSQTLSVPAVVRLTRFVKVPFRGQVSLTRRAIFSRDAGTCVYCTATATTIDHVLPRSRGGRHSWENVVAACHRCNHRKADRTLEELGWGLACAPVAPKGSAWRVLGHRKPDPRWLDWLGLTTAA
ncbi:MAG: HNH endonuclease [Mycobacteriales bacterium]